MSKGEKRDQDDKLMMIIIIIVIIIIYVSSCYHHPSIITIIILMITIIITYVIIIRTNQLSTLEFDQLQLPKPAGQELLEVEGWRRQGVSFLFF